MGKGSSKNKPKVNLYPIYKDYIITDQTVHTCTAEEKCDILICMRKDTNRQYALKLLPFTVSPNTPRKIPLSLNLGSWRF